mmetsp:Transcript_51802/g.171632  ORF Transcript_51802/g.171632 Transcript_51802/m.171632 type:complete len:282 (+) Transcript_51802:115-960(+)
MLCLAPCLIAVLLPSPAAESALAQSSLVYALHKPRGVLSAVGESRARTLTDLMVGAGVVPLAGHAGRLDKETSGLMLITNHSTLLRAVIGQAPVLAEFGGSPVPKRYTLLLAGAHAPERLASLSKPIEITRGGLKPCDGATVLTATAFRDERLATEFHLLGRDDTRRVEAERAALRERRAACRSRASGEPIAAFVPEGGWLTRVELEISQGRHHQIRRLCRRADLKLRHLERTRIGPIELGDLPPGRVRPLDREERRALYSHCLPRVSALISRGSELRVSL